MEGTTDASSMGQTRLDGRGVEGGWSLVFDVAVGQSGLKLGDTTSAHLGSLKVESCQVGQVRQMSQPRITHLGVPKLEVRQVGQVRQVSQSVIAHLGFPKLESCQVGQVRQVCQASIADLGAIKDE